MIFNKVSAHFKTLWYFRTIIIALGFIVVGSVLFRKNTEISSAITLVAIIFVVYMFSFYIRVRYEKLRYSIDGENIYIRDGIIFTRYKYIKRKNIQHTLFFTTPLGRYLKITTIIFFVNGAIVKLDCIDNQKLSCFIKDKPTNTKGVDRDS